MNPIGNRMSFGHVTDFEITIVNFLRNVVNKSTCNSCRNLVFQLKLSFNMTGYEGFHSDTKKREKTHPDIVNLSKTTEETLDKQLETWLEEADPKGEPPIKLPSSSVRAIIAP